MIRFLGLHFFSHLVHLSKHLCICKNLGVTDLLVALVQSTAACHFIKLLSL